MNLKLIPGTQGFLASENGDIYNPALEKRNYYTDPDGYQRCSVLLTDGRWVTFGVHRLVALAHIPYTGDVVKLQVNHIDGIVDNNFVSNLEWVSSSDNNIHASLLRGSMLKPAIIHLNQVGEYSFVSNIYKAAEMFNCDISVIWDKIKTGTALDGHYLYFNSRRSKLPKQLHKPKLVTQPIKQAIKIKNVLDNSIEVFESIYSAASKHYVSSSHIFQCITRDSRVKLFKRKYIIVNINESFPELSVVEYDRLLHPTGRSVICYNEFGRYIKIYESASSFIKENNLSRKTVTVNLKKDRLIKVKGWWFLYLTSINSERIQSIVNSPEL